MTGDDNNRPKNAFNRGRQRLKEGVDNLLGNFGKAAEENVIDPVVDKAQSKIMEVIMSVIMAPIKLIGKIVDCVVGLFSGGSTDSIGSGTFTDAINQLEKAVTSDMTAGPSHTKNGSILEPEIG